MADIVEIETRNDTPLERTKVWELKVLLAYLLLAFLLNLLLGAAGICLAYFTERRGDTNQAAMMVTVSLAMPFFGVRTLTKPGLNKLLSLLNP
ncbi:hypothetical protein [Streptomyces prunicolor]|uniref:hypothetical protein n=1 Tax=Streptomyces prunicolor TaxID=67348 RepID=UPI003419880A